MNDHTAQPPVLVIEEYTTLREEILKRIELQHQLINLALIFAGTLLTISLSGAALGGTAQTPSGGAMPTASASPAPVTSAATTQTNSHSILLLICPILEACLAIAWSSNNVQIAKAGHYIEHRIEAGYLPGGEGWERVWESNEGLGRWHDRIIRYMLTGGFPALGIFVITQAMCVLLAFPDLRFSGIELFLTILDGVAILITFVAIMTSNINRDKLRDYVRAKQSSQAQ